MIYRDILDKIAYKKLDAGFSVNRTIKFMLVVCKGFKYKDISNSVNEVYRDIMSDSLKKMSGFSSYSNTGKLII